MDCFGTYFKIHMPKAVITFLVKVLRNGPLRCKTRQLENENTFCRFRVSLLLCFSHLRASLIASAIIDCDVFLLSAKTAFLLCAFSPFSRFRFFPFSCLAFPPFSPFSGFRVFAFSCSAGGIPAAGTQISCAQPKLWESSAICCTCSRVRRVRCCFPSSC